MAGSMVYRTKAGSATAANTVLLMSAMEKIQSKLDNNSFNWVAGLHGRPDWYCWHHQRNRRFPDTRAQLFLPWHRAYLHQLEMMLQDSEESAALTYWDWTSDKDIPESHSRQNVDSKPNPLYRYRMRLAATEMQPAVNRYTVRRPGMNSFVRLPTRDEVVRLLDEQDWSRFSDALQGLHDNVHVWVGGDMGNPAFAGFDPVFYAHHCMIDRVWFLWQQRHGNGNMPPSLLDMKMEPFALTVRDVMDVQSLGYEYAATATPLPV